MKKILFYSDAARMGGHEHLVLEAIKYLSTYYDIYVIISSYNLSFYKKLVNISNVKIFLIIYKANKYQIIRNFISFKTSNCIKKILESVQPDLIVSVQGSIDSSFLCNIANIKLKIKSISYLPFAHNLSDVSKYHLIGLLKDLFRNYYYYRVPSGYITLNNAIKKQIQLKSKNSNICIAHNGIEFDNYKKINKNEVRDKFLIPINRYVIGIVGRIEIWHKGLDYLVDFLHKFGDNYSEVLFLIIGNGDDTMLFKKKCSCFSNVKFLPWSNNVSEIYSLIDCFLLLSRFEGVPLTVLEATYFELPIVASRLDGMENFVSDQYLFDVGDIKQLDQILSFIINNKFVEKKNIENISLENFKKEFHNSIKYFCS